MNTEVAFVLVDPEQPLNVGAVARVMANLGWSDLRIVGEKQPPWSEVDAARRMAHGALAVLEQARRFTSLAEAVEDRSYLIGTSARRREVRRSHRLDAGLASRAALEENVVVVFGNERRGLANEHLALCHEVVSIQTYGAQTSLNLSQAALLVGFTIRGYAEEETPRPKRVRPVTRQIDHTLARLDDALEQIGFWRPGLEDRSRGHLRRILLRGVESTQELGILERLAHRIRLFVAGKIPPLRGDDGD